ncbi:MAG: GTP-binding protein [Methylococcaceae bacterium]|nr:MAG: GTP-binding protein [Methylococcaceae bacterium]
MALDLQHLAQQARLWAEQGVAAGWLVDEHAIPLRRFENHTPDTLFEHDVARPLVVAFFGGTGVGKSSLLNRLAGQPVARTGVERPTSREVSVFLHESVHLQRLPGDFPLEKVKIARHQEAGQRHIMWIDMPDMDSTEHGNREQVMAWLPHIDVLVYVVSPERYRDEKAWRLLQSHGSEHAWLFIMNQWDRAQEVQKQDFGKQLARAGFTDPVILCTDCREPAAARQTDDFPQLAQIIHSLCDHHTVGQLEQRTRQARLQQLAETLAHCLEKLAGAAGAEELQQRWKDQWEQAELHLLQGLQWPMQQYVQAFVARDGNPLRPQLKLTKAETNSGSATPSAYTLWDDWAQSLVDDAMDRLVVEASQTGLSHSALKSRVEQLKPGLPSLIMRQAQQSLRLALANPGNALQRFALRCTAFLTVVLPLAALGWVGYQVLTAYQASAASHANYLGSDFAIHSGLLIGISWLLPWFIHRQLAPSAEKAALKGLRLGVMAGLANVEQMGNEMLKLALQERNGFEAQGWSIVQRCGEATGEEQAMDAGLLGRLLQGHTPSAAP